MSGHEEPWRSLALAPTHDALAIKRAYARRLKLTRPDVDPEGYQALRQAYEWALHLAAELSDEAAAAAEEGGALAQQSTHSEALAPSAAAAASVAEAPAALNAAIPAAGSDTASPTTAAAQPSADASASAEPVASAAETLAPDAPTTPGAAADSAESQATPAGVETGAAAETQEPSPEELARSLYGYFHQHGAEATIELGPRIAWALDGVPLSRRDEASWWFAKLVTECPDLPAPTAALLADYFEWSRDYRSRSALGEELGRQLDARLLAIGYTRTRDPDLLNRYRRLQVIHAALEAGQRLRAYWLGLLSAPRNLERYVDSSPERLASLGLPRIGGTLMNCLEHTQHLYLGMLLALLLLLAGSEGRAQLLQLVLPLAFIVTGLRLGPWLDLLIQRWSEYSVQRLAVATFVVVMSLGLLDSQPEALGGSVELVAILLQLFALGLGWLPDQRWRACVPSLVIVLGLALGQHEDLNGLVGTGMAMIWVSISQILYIALQPQIHTLYRRQTYERWLPDNDIARVVLMILAIRFLYGLFLGLAACLLPMTYLVQARTYGARFAIHGLLVALCINVLWQLEVVESLLTLVLTPIALALLQRLQDWYANRMTDSRRSES